MRLRNGLFLLVIQPFGDSRDWKIVPTDNQRKRKKAVALTVSLVDLVWGNLYRTHYGIYYRLRYPLS